MRRMQTVAERVPRAAEDDPDAEETDPVVPPVRTESRPSRPETWLRVVLDRVWSAAFLAVASLGLYEADFVSELLHAPQANRPFVHLGVLFGTLLGLFGCYIEVYRGLILGERVDYDKAKTATHGMLLSMCLSGICLAIGMWPVWQWLTLPYLFMWSWGVVVQLLVILPPVVQRVVFAGGYVWFMHNYLSTLLVSS